MKEGIIIVSFGTSYEEAEKKGIKPVEEYLWAQFPQYPFYSAYTSKTIKRILEMRGRSVFNLEEALDECGKNGAERIYIQPTHLLYGEEYEKIQETARLYKGQFLNVKLGLPLLGGTEDIKEVLSAVYKRYRAEDGEALVLMGHGTGHFSNTLYAACDYMAKESGFQNMYVGCVEAYPLVNVVCEQVVRDGFKKAVLLPFMLTAGDHAVNDMAGEEKGSWRRVFEEAGIQTKIILKGLGELEPVKKLYAKHLEALLHD